MTHFKIFTLLLFLLFASTSATAQHVSQDIPASKWEKGEYQRYNVTKNSQMKFYEEDVEIKFNADGKVAYVLLTKMYKFMPVYAPGTDFVVSFAKNEDEHLYFTGNSIVWYDIDKRDGTVEFVKTVINEKVPSIKKIMAEIDVFRAETFEVAKVEKEKEDARVYEAYLENTTNNKTINKIEIELISDDAKIDCDSKFYVGYIVYLDDDRVLKSKNLGGGLSDREFQFSVVGATALEPDSSEFTSLYQVSKYCEKMKDKEMVIYVRSLKASGEQVRARNTYPTSCVPDPKIIAENEARKKAEAEAARIEEARNAVAEAEAAKRRKELAENGHKVTLAGAFKNSSNKWGIKDASGKIIVPAEYDQFDTDYHNGLVGAQKNGKWGFIDKEGNVVIPCVYHFAASFQSNGYAKVGKKPYSTMYYGIIDKKGKELVPLCYTYISSATPKKANNGKYYYLVQVNKNWGLVNADGRLVLDAIYESVKILNSNRSEDFEVRYNGQGNKNHYGYVTDYADNSILTVDWKEADVQLVKIAWEYSGEFVVYNDLEKRVYINAGDRETLMSGWGMEPGDCRYIKCSEYTEAVFYSNSSKGYYTKLFDTGKFDEGKVYLLSDVFKNNGISLD